MDFHPVERASEAFQQSLTAEEIEQVCRRAFGGDATPVSAVELGMRMYNNVYRVTLADQARPVILRVAPPNGRQFRSERHLMRNPGYATWSEAVIASLEEIAADLDGVGLDAADVRKVAAVAAHESAVIDEVTEPRLLTGDLWTVH
ncbi:hypothetical protein [Streptomyces sp. NPDC052092]|uniref:hypothetical protein n=1 Tax=Streptomyces sp. NPDC052092 TaxID=3365685 RepID=UPI0037D26A25